MEKTALFNIVAAC